MIGITGKHDNLYTLLLPHALKICKKKKALLDFGYQIKSKVCQLTTSA